MKNLTLLAVLLVSFQFSAFANNEIESKVILIDEAKVKVSMSSELSSKLIISSSFDQDDNQVEIEFHNNVSSVKVFDYTGEMIFTVPVLSNEFNLGLALFEEGNYKLGFIFDGDSDIKVADITIR